MPPAAHRPRAATQPPRSNHFPRARTPRSAFKGCADAGGPAPQAFSRGRPRPCLELTHPPRSLTARPVHAPHRARGGPTHHAKRPSRTKTNPRDMQPAIPRADPHRQGDSPLHILRTLHPPRRPIPSKKTYRLRTRNLLPRRFSRVQPLIRTHGPEEAQRNDPIHTRRIRQGARGHSRRPSLSTGRVPTPETATHRPQQGPTQHHERCASRSAGSLRHRRPHHPPRTPRPRRRRTRAQPSSCKTSTPKPCGTNSKT